MSTPQTDAYWKSQESIYQDFCDYVNEHTEVQSWSILKELKGIHLNTYNQCRNYIIDTFSDDRLDEFREQKEERDREYAEMHYAPSEGFDR